jgi:hypothetical protein
VPATAAEALLALSGAYAYAAAPTPMRAFQAKPTTGPFAQLYRDWARQPAVGERRWLTVTLTIDDTGEDAEQLLAPLRAVADLDGDPATGPLRVPADRTATLLVQGAPALAAAGVDVVIPTSTGPPASGRRCPSASLRVCSPPTGSSVRTRR